ncbi:putative DNA-binding protein [Virgibacillus sp. W0430]|uniref:putative DNA-binding protein n=1 Tax=Virgibacillus sp. W0430 TaxID=3391580 RepID=UPI003F44EA0F
MVLEKTTRINNLFDFYDRLLTAKQRKYMEMYYVEDYSLGEIAQLSKVSRQAVYDNIKRTEQILEMYEEKLHLYEKFEKRTELLAKLSDRIMTTDTDSYLSALINELKELD